MLKLGPKAGILDPIHRIIWLLLCYLVALRVHWGDPGDPSDRQTPQLMPVSRDQRAPVSVPRLVQSCVPG